MTSLKETEMQVISAVSALLVVATIAVPTLWFTQAAEAHAPEMKDMTAIEASIAMRKEKVNQPQKHFRPPDEVQKPIGVSHDEKKDPPPPKPDEDKPPPKHDEKVDTNIDRFKHHDDDDAPAGSSKPVVGDFNGSEKGFGDITTGDPWLGQLNADMHYAPPAIAKGDSVPVGCIHLTAEGKIVDTKFDVKTDDDLQTAAETAIDALKKLRNDHPVPVPDHLLPLTTKWLCFKFSIAK